MHILNICLLDPVCEGLKLYDISGWAVQLKESMRNFLPEKEERRRDNKSDPVGYI